MKRSNRHSQGFSLPEVLIASTLLFTFATLSVGSYRDHVQHEQLKASRASAQAWLEDVSRIAQQFNTHCLLEVNLAAGTLQESHHSSFAGTQARAMSLRVEPEWLRISMETTRDDGGCCRSW